MLRHYYISDDLDDLKMLEDELSDSGFVTPQFHVLTEQDAECEKRHLHAIEPVLKKDVVHLTQVGAIVGLIVASALMFTSWLLGLSCSAGLTPHVLPLCKPVVLSPFAEKGVTFRTPRRRTVQASKQAAHTRCWRHGRRWAETACVYCVNVYSW